MAKLIEQLSHANYITFQQLEDIIELVDKVHGFSLDGYSRASLKRRMARIMQLQNLSLFELKSLLINSGNYFEDFLREITVNVTEMFRDPDFYKLLRDKVLPYVSSYQRIKIWNAGCSSGEELYSFAILLFESKLYDRAFLYGTDINSKVLAVAKQALYDLKKMKLYSENYHAAGLEHSLADYYNAANDTATLNINLKKNTLFSVHNLVSDGVFNEFQVISCRNVLIYFDVELQEKVLRLFYESLCPLGFLCLGSKETLRVGDLKNQFKIIDSTFNIYQKIA